MVDRRKRQIPNMVAYLLLLCLSQLTHLAMGAEKKTAENRDKRQAPGVFPGNPQFQPGNPQFQPGNPQGFPGAPGAFPGSQPFPGAPGQFPGQQPFPGAPGQFPGQQPFPGAPGQFPGQQPFPGAPGTFPGSQPFGAPGSFQGNQPFPGGAPFPQQPLPGQPFPGSPQQPGFPGSFGAGGMIACPGQTNPVCPCTPQMNCPIQGAMPQVQGTVCICCAPAPGPAGYGFAPPAQAGFQPYMGPQGFGFAGFDQPRIGPQVVSGQFTGFPAGPIPPGTSLPVSSNFFQGQAIVSFPGGHQPIQQLPGFVQQQPGLAYNPAQQLPGFSGWQSLPGQPFPQPGRDVGFVPSPSFFPGGQVQQPLLQQGGFGSIGYNAAQNPCCCTPVLPPLPQVLPPQQMQQLPPCPCPCPPLPPPPIIAYNPPPPPPPPPPMPLCPVNPCPPPAPCCPPGWAPVPAPGPLVGAAAYGAQPFGIAQPQFATGMVGALPPAYGFGPYANRAANSVRSQLMNNRGSQRSLNEVGINPFSKRVIQEIQCYKVIVFTQTPCKACYNTMETLSAALSRINKGELQSFDISAFDFANYEEADRLFSSLRSLTGSSTLPQVFVCGEYIGGADQTETSIRNGSFSAVLGTCLKERPSPACGARHGVPELQTARGQPASPAQNQNPGGPSPKVAESLAQLEMQQIIHQQAHTANVQAMLNNAPNQNDALKQGQQQLKDGNVVQMMNPLKKKTAA